MLCVRKAQKMQQPTSRRDSGSQKNSSALGRKIGTNVRSGSKPTIEEPACGSPPQKASFMEKLLTLFDVQNNARQQVLNVPTPPPKSGSLLIQPHVSPMRRESFLYRPDMSEFPGQTPRSSTRSQLLPCLQENEPHQHTSLHGEDFIVTPFAQILASLRNVRQNFIAITNANNKSKAPSESAMKHNNIESGHHAHLLRSNTPSETNVLSHEDSSRLASETLVELEWCLEQLETIQTHRSVSEMASSKFRKMLNKELSQFAESKSANQISEFIVNTFMDKEQDVDVPEDNNGSQPDISMGSQRNSFSSKKPVISAMSRISGIRQLKHRGSIPPSSSQMPQYGIEVPKNEEFSGYMEKLDTWGTNIFRIDQLSGGHPVACLVYSIFKERDLLRIFSLDAQRVVTYLLHLEEHYKPNPYHNSIHAADVAQSVHVLLQSQALENVFTDLEILAAIFAAAVHDVDHPGYTNQYLINTGSELAIMYNDDSVLEQHHLAVAFRLLQESECDFVASLSKKQRQTFRKIIIDMVIATDMSKHMNLLADLKTMVETKKVAGSGSGILLLDNYQDRIQMLQNMIHLADLSNPTKSLELYKQWTDRIMEEYWRQGDKERELKMEISPMCDRYNATVAKSQVGFIDFIVHPLWETWADLVFPDAQLMLDNLEENRDYYQALISDSPDIPKKDDVVIKDNK